jgi:hypothetical protein
MYTNKKITVPTLTKVKRFEIKSESKSDYGAFSYKISTYKNGRVKSQVHFLSWVEVENCCTIY